MNMKNPWRIYKNGELYGTAKSKENAEKQVKRFQKIDRDLNRCNKTEKHTGEYDIREVSTSPARCKHGALLVDYCHCCELDTPNVVLGYSLGVTEG